MALVLLTGVVVGFLGFFSVKGLVKISSSKLFEIEFIRGHMAASTKCDEE